MSGNLSVTTVKLRALRLLTVDGMRIAPGATFKVDEKTAYVLLSWGDAEVAASRTLMDGDPFAGRLTYR